MRSIRLLIPAALFLAACSNAASPTADQTPTPQSSVSASAQASSSSTPLPTKSSAEEPQTPQECRGLADNSHKPTQVVDATKPIYYFFGCDNDQRYILRITNNVGHLVAAELQSEYSFLVIDFAVNSKLAIQTFSGDTAPREVEFDFSGDPTDLKLSGLARVVGPTNNPQDMYPQDCLDYQFMYNSTDCAELAGISTSFSFIERGDESDWINNYGD